MKVWSGKVAKGYKWNGFEWRMRREAAKAKVLYGERARLMKALTGK